MYATDLTVGVLTATTVSIAGTLTYEDVTNVDSVGLITARNDSSKWWELMFHQYHHRNKSLRKRYRYWTWFSQLQLTPVSNNALNANTTGNNNTAIGDEPHVLY